MMPTLRHHLEGPKGRRYVFEPVQADLVIVRRHEGLRCVQERRLSRERARNLYAWLRRIGYRRW